MTGISGISDNEGPYSLELSLSEWKAGSHTAQKVCQITWGIVLGIFAASDRVQFGLIDEFNSKKPTGTCIVTLSDNVSLNQVSCKRSLCDEGELDLDSVLCVQPARISNELSGFEELLHIITEETAISILINRNKPLFSFGTRVRSFSRTFQHILRQVIDQPHLKLQEVNLITDEEHLQLAQWNTHIPNQYGICIHTAIVEQCLKSPQKPAVNAWDGSLSYGELEALSARLAGILISQKIPTGSIIPLCFEKGKWAIVAVLAVLRAGAAYVFIDPASPHSRANSICDDVKADLIVCSNACMSMASQLVSRVIAVEDLMSEMASGPDPELKSPVVALTDPVYAVFTSGSTGRPKGVLIEHGKFYQRAMANAPTLSLSGASRVLQFASFMFDVANRDILYTLLFGGCICIPSDLQRTNELSSFMKQQRVNWISIIPSACRILDPDDLPDLRTMVLCGEAMTRSLVVKWADRLHLINAYGPSEAVTISTMATFQSSESPVHIGKGSGSVIWIVDPADHDRLVPVGALGEMVIESPCVSRGYLNRPAETASSFLPTTKWFSGLRSDPASIYLYKTGDLAQYGEDGTILFRGRKDGQVKINGQRVDLGDIEHWIQKLLPSDAGFTVVVDQVLPKGRESPLLLAFCAPQNAQILTLESLRQILPPLARELERDLPRVLPTYMIPRVYFPVQSIPTTETGKIHRRQLRQIGASHTIEALTQVVRTSVSLREKSYYELSGPVARILLGSLALALEMSELSIRGHDNFLWLGGDSAMAIRVVVHARSQGLDVTVTDLLRSKTLVDLTNDVAARDRISQIRMTPELFSLCDQSTVRGIRQKLAHLDSQYSILDVLPTTAAQNFFLTQWSLSCYRCILSGPIDFNRLQAACTAVVYRHSILRTVFTPLDEGGFAQVILKTVDSTLERRRVIDERLEDVCQPIIQNLITEISPTSGQPLVRFIMLSRSDTEHTLLVRVCHAQYDGNTSPTLFKDISAAYNNANDTNGSDMDLLPAAAPFQHYLYAREQKRSSPGDDPAIQFWRQNLQDSRMTILTSAFPSKSDIEPEARIITEPISIPLPTVFENITVPTLLNAACSLLLAVLVSDNDVVFGNVMDTRGAGAFPGIETTLGTFLNINPLRVRLDVRESTTFADLCHSLADQTACVARHAATWDLPDIVMHCTDWPADTQFGCVLNHTRLNTRPPPLTLDGVTCASFEKTVENDMGRQLLFECSAGRDRLEIQAVTSTALMDFKCATRLVERLVSAVVFLSRVPDTLLADVHV